MACHLPFDCFMSAYCVLFRLVTILKGRGGDEVNAIESLMVTLRSFSLEAQMLNESKRPAS